MGNSLSKTGSKKLFPWLLTSPMTCADKQANGHMTDGCTGELENIAKDGKPGAQSLYTAALQNAREQIQAMVADGIDINIPLNDKCETALFIAVKMANLDVVEWLLGVSGINLNCYNIHCCSVLDIALITAFDSRREAQYNDYWKIICLLMSNDVEPLSKDAMTYMLRTALKEGDDDFINRFISAAASYSTSIKLHLYFLEKLHRQQPIYPGNMDSLLESATSFTIRLLRCANDFMLRSIVHSLIYYLESYWKCKKLKCDTFCTLVVFATGAGWVWTTQQLPHIEKIHTDLAFWCCNQRFTPNSLTHMSRVAYRSSVDCTVHQSLELLPFSVPEKIKRYILLHDLDKLPADILSLQF